jgi:periplasmic divalent cation tolerance protein
MSAPGLYVVTTTFPDRAAAERVASLLVDAGLAACAQVGADLVSFYRWEGKVCRSPEVAVVLKVLPDRLELCLGDLRQLHPYDVPQIVAWEADHVSREYQAWARGEGR